MKMERCLLVGGPFDGQWREIEAGVHHIMTTYIPPTPVTPWPADAPPPDAPYQQHQYIRLMWNVGSKTYGEPLEIRSIFVHGHTSATAFDRLLESYKPTEMARLQQELKETRAILAACNDQLQLARRQLGLAVS